MGLWFGLSAAFGWGLNDFLLGRLGRNLGARQTMLWIELFSLVSLGLLLLIRGEGPPSVPSWLWGLALVVNGFNVVGNWLLYRALAIGTLAVVSPVAASFAVVTALLATMGGERLGLPAVWGVVLVIIGVAGVTHAAGDGQPTSLRGIGSAVGSALANGIFFWLVGPVAAGMGAIWPVLIGRVMGVVLALALVWLARERPQRPLGWQWQCLVLTALFDTGAFLCYNLGIATTQVSVVTALASIFSAVTVVLAWLFLRERLAVPQWAGIATVLIGVWLVSL